MQLVHGHPFWIVFAVQRPLSGRVKYCVGAMQLGTQPNTQSYPVQKPHGQLTALLYWCSGRTASWFVVFCWGVSAQPIDCSILLCMARTVCVCLVCACVCMWGGCVLYMGLCVGMCSCVCFVYISFVHVQRATLHQHILGSPAGSLCWNPIGSETQHLKCLERLLPPPFSQPEALSCWLSATRLCLLVVVWCGLRWQSMGVMVLWVFPPKS
jgi:hypothetical protein